MTFHGRSHLSTTHSKLRFESLEERVLLTFVPQRVLHDGFQADPYDDSFSAAVAAGQLFIVAYDQGDCYEVWRSTGKAFGLEMMTENPNFDSCLRGKPERLTAVGADVFFTVEDSHGTEVWRSDGSKAGTYMVRDIVPGPGSSIFPGSDFIDFNGILFFSAKDSNGSGALWRSDGTEAGTTRVKNTGFSPSGFAVLGNTLYFADRDAIWKSDGTEAGTVRVASAPINPTDLFAHNGKVYFIGTTIDSGRELWASDGTQAGTRMVKDVRPGSSGSQPAIVASVGDKLFFTADDAVHGVELWVTDGTSRGTVLVKDIRDGSAGAPVVAVENLNGTLYFTVNDGVHGFELWRTDGTGPGTMIVKDALPGLDGLYPRRLKAIDDTLFFTAYTPEVGNELWQSDGTETGTKLVADIYPGRNEYYNYVYSSNPTHLNYMHGTLYFFLNSENGFALYNLIEYPTGDTNFDGVVDLTDLNNVRNHFGATGDVLADTNDDGVVDLVDLNAVRAHFGERSETPSDSQAPPPPTPGEPTPTSPNRREANAQRRSLDQNILFFSSERISLRAPSNSAAAKRLRVLDRVFESL